MERISNSSRVISVLILLILLPTITSAGFKEQRLAVIPPGYMLDNSNIVFTPDGSKVACAVRLGDAMRVVFGDRVGKLYQIVRDISISPDGRFVAHNGTPDLQRDEEYRVVNGIETGPFQQVCNPTFSPDSRMVVFEAKSADKWRHAISAVDSNRIAAETGKADLHWMGPVFSPDGRLIVSIQQHRDAKKNVRLVSTAEMREVRRREYDSIVDVVYSADGLRTAYNAQKGGKAFVVTSSFAGGDEREGAAYDRVSRLVLSDNGDHIAYFAERDGKRFIVVDGREIPAPFFYDHYPQVFSRDWSTFAYGALKEGKQFIVVAGKETPRYDDLSNFALSPDGRAVAYGACAGGKWRLIVNGDEGPAYDSVDAVRFAPDGKHVIFRAARGDKRCMVISDLKGNVVREGPLFDEIWEPSFDVEGRLGYGALEGREIWWKTLVVD